MKTIKLTVALFFLFVIAAQAQTPSVNHSQSLIEAPPQTVGMSPKRLDRIDAMARKAIEKREVPGLVAIVARNGKIVFHKAYGVSDVASNRKLQKDDIFRIASQTKAITATAVMMLWEEGLFRLDDPISKWIPEFKNMEVLIGEGESLETERAKSQITIRHLLTHSSGIGYGLIDGDPRMRKMFKEANIVDAWTTKPILLADNIKKLATMPLHFHPGERYQYGEGLDVLGYFIEIISGQTFAKFLESRLFQPLGMVDTAFFLTEENEDRLVTVHQPRGSDWVKYEGVPEYYDADYPVKGAKTYYGGGAGLVSTAKDYANFLQMYLNGGELNGVRILSRKTIETINAFQVKLNDHSHYGLAFGVLNEKAVSRGGEGSEGTFNWGGYFNSQYFADPKEQLLGVILKQTRRQSNDSTSWKFRHLAIQAIDD